MIRLLDVNFKPVEEKNTKIRTLNVLCRQPELKAKKQQQLQQQQGECPMYVHNETAASHNNIV